MSDVSAGDPSEGSPLAPQLVLLQRLERALGLAVLSLFGVYWVWRTRNQSAAPASITAEVDLEAFPPLLHHTLTVVGIGCIAASLRFGPRILRALARALRDPDSVVLNRPPRLAHFLVTLGGFYVVLAVLSVAATERPQLAFLQGPLQGTERPAVGVTFSPDAPASDTVVSAETLEGPVSVRWTGTHGRLELASTGAPSSQVAVDGVPAHDGVLLPAGAELQLGAHTVRWEAPTPQAQLWGMAGAQLLATGLLVLVLTSFGGGATVGWTAAGGVGREVARGVGVYLCFVPVYYGLVLGSAYGVKALGLPVQDHALVTLLQREGLGLMGPIAAQAVVLAPLTEEVVFRGVLVPGFVRAWGPWLGWGAAALVFSFVHPGWGSLLPLFALGGLFAGLYVTSPKGSLVAPMTAHALHNAHTLALTYVVLQGAR